MICTHIYVPLNIPPHTLIHAYVHLYVCTYSHISVYCMCLPIQSGHNIYTHTHTGAVFNKVVRVKVQVVTCYPPHAL